MSQKQLKVKSHREKQPATADPAKRREAGRILRVLSRAYPDAACALSHHDAYQLLVATILSAQCTDARVNQVTPRLFARYPDPESLARANPHELEDLIRSTGFFRNKARNLLGMARAVVDAHAGAIPADLEALVHLPGVGRKTAQVVLGTAFGLATGVVVDTHVLRLSRRLGLSTHRDPVRVEKDLMRLFPRKEWISLSHRLIHHGRQVCVARKPRCGDCALAGICPKIGVPGQSVAKPAERSGLLSRSSRIKSASRKAR
jgi:endonuclease-3